MNVKIAVAINIYQESLSQVGECFSRLHSNLPAAAVSIFINGAARPEIVKVAGQYGYRVAHGANLGTNKTWHLWWLRMFDFFTSCKADICFKFDPDTMVDRPPAFFPNADYFGDISLNKRYNFEYVQGGVTGLSLRVVHRMLECHLLTPNPGKRWFTTLPKTTPFVDDQLIGAALQAMRVVPVAWPECKSVWREPVANNPIRYAIVHPRYYSSEYARITQ